MELQLPRHLVHSEQFVVCHAADCSRSPQIAVYDSYLLL
jgi:hypothetical protein